MLVSVGVAAAECEVSSQFQGCNGYNPLNGRGFGTKRDHRGGQDRLLLTTRVFLDSRILFCRRCWVGNSYLCTTTGRSFPLAEMRRAGFAFHFARMLHDNETRAADQQQDGHYQGNNSYEWSFLHQSGQFKHKYKNLNSSLPLHNYESTLHDCKFGLRIISSPERQFLIWIGEFTTNDTPYGLPLKR